jgi:uncharacterized damage-inducible protein DinB
MTTFASEEAQPRVDPAPQSDERTTLSEFLTWQRDTIRVKCAGLDAEQLARHAVEPSGMSLLGLIRHLADVERNWFRRIMAGLDAPALFYSDAEPDGEFTAAAADPDQVLAAAAAWADEVAFAARFVAGAPDMGLVSVGRNRVLGHVSLRWVLVHMIEEYARHAGHADLLRERIDGSTGE